MNQENNNIGTPENLNNTKNRVNKQRVSCMVLSCKIKSARCDLRFFKLPTTANRRSIWLNALGIKEDELKIKNNFICERHFLPEHLGVEQLTRNAIPTLKVNNFLENDVTNESSQYPVQIVPHTVSVGIQWDGTTNNNEDDFLKLINEINCQHCTIGNQDLDNCRQCNKKSRKLAATLKKNRDLQTRLKQLKAAYQKVRRNFIILKKKYNKKNSVNIEDTIEKLTINDTSKNVCKLLLKNDFYYKKSDKTFAQCLYYKSASTYKYLRNILKLRLPSVSSIYKWSPIQFIAPGVNDLYVLHHKQFFQNQSINSRVCTLSFDEIAIKQDLTFNILTDRIEGFYDDGVERKNELASSALFFMVRSLIGNWQYVLNYVLINKSFCASNLANLIKTNVKICQERLNLDIVMLTCDQFAINIQTYKILGIEPDNPYFELNGKRIYAQFDAPHLIKSVRNALLTNQISHEEYGTADINVIGKIHNYDEAQSCKILPKLTKKHLSPNTFEKMNVRLATQLLSNTTSCAIKTALQNCPEIFGTYVTNALATAKFIEQFNNIFDCLNCQHFSSTAPYQQPLRRESKTFAYLKSSLEFLKGLKILSKNANYFKFIKGFQITINSQLLLIEYLNKKYEIDYILTRKTNQDGLENFFSKLRGKGGFNNMPTSHEVGVHFANIVVTKIMFQSEYSNCSPDDDSLPELDWTNFQEDYHNSLTSLEPHSESLDEDDSWILNLEIDIIKTNAISYYAGFCAYKKIKCNACKKKLLKENDVITSPSETFLSEKNYNKTMNFGSLKAPTEMYVEMAIRMVNIFDQVYRKQCHLPNICKKITDVCLSIVERDFHTLLPPTHDDPCFEHIKQLINYFILILTRKNSKWSVLKGEFKTAKHQNRTGPTKAAKRIRILNKST